MEWTILNKNFAYKKQKELISITSIICLGKTLSVLDEIADPDDFMIIDKETIYMQDWCDLRQFNNSNDLIHKIQGINIALGNSKFELDDFINKNELKIKNPKLENNVLSGTICYNGEEFNFKNQLYKYCWIDDSICENRTWDLKELFEFTVLLQKEMFKLEEELSTDSMNLSIDKEIINKLKK